MSRRPGQIDFGEPDDVPSLSAAGYSDAPVECELCWSHERFPHKSFCHVHDVDFGDCFTFGPSTDRLWLDYSEDSAMLAARTVADQPHTVSLNVKRRQHMLATKVTDAIRRALSTFDAQRPLRASLPLLGQRPGPHETLLLPRLDRKGRRCGPADLATAAA